MLRERAERERRSPDEIAVAILNEALVFEPETLEETVAGIQQWLADHREGRTRSLDDYDTAARARFDIPDRGVESRGATETEPGVVEADR
jgi:hypothetical protein